MSAAVLELEGLTTGYEDAAVVREPRPERRRG